MVTAKLVTIIAESVLRDRLVRDLKELGVSGYTESQVRGEGSRGRRTVELEGQNVQIDTLVSPALATKIFERVSEAYFEHYAVVAFARDVEVLREDKYL